MSWFNEHEAESLVQSMKATKPWIEQSREFGGLLIISIVITINMVNNKKNLELIQLRFFYSDASIIF